MTRICNQTYVRVVEVHFGHARIRSDPFLIMLTEKTSVKLSPLKKLLRFFKTLEKENERKTRSSLNFNIVFLLGAHGKVDKSL